MSPPNLRSVCDPHHAGHPQAEQYARKLLADIEASPMGGGTRLLWAHAVPFYQARAGAAEFLGRKPAYYLRYERRYLRLLYGPGQTV